MSEFGNKIKALLDGIGRNEQWLSDQTGIAKSTISEWGSNPDRIPKPPTMHKLVKLFTPYGIDPDEIYEAAGYRMVESQSANERMQRLERLAATDPSVLDQMENIAQLPPPDQEEIVRLLDAWFTARRRRPRGRK